MRYHAFRSLIVMFALYGLVFAIGDAYLLHGGAPLWWGIVFVVALIGIQYLGSPWLIEHIYAIAFYEDDIPVVHREFVAQLCRGVAAGCAGRHLGRPHSVSVSRHVSAEASHRTAGRLGGFADASARRGA